MKKLLLASLISLLTATSTHAAPQCLNIGPGAVVINHRQGVLYGRNFYAWVSCTWGAPVIVYWRGGAMCSGRRFYGRSLAGRPFACLVRRVGWR